MLLLGAKRGDQASVAAGHGCCAAKRVHSCCAHAVELCENAEICKLIAAKDDRIRVWQKRPQGEGDCALAPGRIPDLF